MTPATAVSTFLEGRGGDAAALVFEYMAAAQAETGQAVPAGSASCPPRSSASPATCQRSAAHRERC
jgi:hypothetical protein